MAKIPRISEVAWPPAANDPFTIPVCL